MSDERRFGQLVKITGVLAWKVFIIFAAIPTLARLFQCDLAWNDKGVFACGYALLAVWAWSPWDAK